jgi:hypothetical protein
MRRMTSYTQAWKARATRPFKKIDPVRAACLYQDGPSSREVAKKLGCNVSTVLDALRMLKVERRPVGDVEGKAWRGYHARRRAALRRSS